MYSNHREAYRQAFLTTWQKYLKKSPLEAVEKQMIDVMLDHPAYQRFFISEKSLTDNYELHDNPFFHLSLHLTIREQIKMNRPVGVREVYQALLEKYGDAHEVEHAMMEVIAGVIYEAKESGVRINDVEYLAKLTHLSSG